MAKPISLKWYRPAVGMMLRDRRKSPRYLGLWSVIEVGDLWSSIKQNKIVTTASLYWEHWEQIPIVEVDNWVLMDKHGMPVPVNAPIDFNGTTWTVTGGTPPSKPKLGGKVSLASHKGTTDFYVSVFRFQWEKKT